MARGKKTGGRDFKPGAAPKSPGRPPSPPELKAARRLTKTAFEEICNRFIHMTKVELREAKREPERTLLEHIVIAVLEKAEDWGDTGKLNFVLARLIGNVPDKLEVSDPDAPRNMTPEERRKRIAELQAMRDKSRGRSSG